MATSIILIKKNRSEKSIKIYYTLLLYHLLKFVAFRLVLALKRGKTTIETIIQGKEGRKKERILAAWGEKDKKNL